MIHVHACSQEGDTNLAAGNTSAPLQISEETRVKTLTSSHRPSFFPLQRLNQEFNILPLLAAPQISTCTQGDCPGEKCRSDGERNQNCSRCSGGAGGLAPHPGFGFACLCILFCFTAVPQRGVCSSRDYSHSGIWMSAGKTEDFRCIQGISVFLITLQGFYHKLLLWIPTAVGAHQFGACFLQEL